MNIRHPNEEDFDAVLGVLQASDRAVFGDSDWTVEGLRDEWQELDLGHDAWLVELDDEVAGVMHLYSEHDGRFNADGYVHPRRRGQGVGSRLLDLAEERARERLEAAPGGHRVVMDTAYLVGDADAPSLLAGKGFEQVRTFFRMVVDLEDTPDRPLFPPGLELRPFEVQRDGPTVHAAVEEAFVDEWSFQPRPYGDWRERTFDRVRFDPSLVPAVWDGDELAAVSLNYWKRMGDWGWIGTLAVRRAWRRRGLGLALLQESFHRFRERDERTVALGVDSENPTGATRLYERAGMRVLWRADVWQKELRAAE